MENMECERCHKDSGEYHICKKCSDEIRSNTPEGQKRIDKWIKCHNPNKKKLIEMIKSYGKLSYDLGYNWEDYEWVTTTKNVDNYFKEIEKFINEKF